MKSKGSTRNPPTPKASVWQALTCLAVEPALSEVEWVATATEGGTSLPAVVLSEPEANAPITRPNPGGSFA